MTPKLEDWVTTRRLANLLALPQDTTANLYRRPGFPAHAMLRRDGYLLWHYPSVEAWRNACRKHGRKRVVASQFVPAAGQKCAGQGLV